MIVLCEFLAQAICLPTRISLKLAHVQSVRAHP